VPLTTARLLLRPFTVADVDDVWEFQRRADVARYLLWEPRDRMAAEQSVRAMTAETQLVADGDCLALAAVLPGEDKVIGQVELVLLSREHRQGEIGYVFNPAHHGHGYATEAVGEVLRLGFEGLDLHRIVGHCNADNEPSARLMERLGMRREAHFIGSTWSKGAWRDEYVYAIRREEWSVSPRTAAGST
jgi:RimJ/RimL family protein N-acetyltransferase